MEPIQIKPGRTKSKKFVSIYFIILLILGSFVFGLFIGRSKTVQQNFLTQQELISNKYSEKSEKIDFNLFWDTWDLVEKKFVHQPLDYQKMLYGAIAGMVASLGDPYTAFMNPEMTRKFKEEIEGSFEGIGAEIGIKNDRLTIIAPLASSPAERAGLRAHDWILKIDGKETSTMSLVEAVSLIRGQKGTEVTLTIKRGDEEAKDYKIVREKIDVKSVKWEKISTSSGLPVAHIKLSYFGEKTADELKSAASEILSSDVKGIILDLRNNAGGYLESSIDVTSLFLEKDKLTVTQVASSGEKKEYKTRGGDTLSSFPLVILINNGSASAPEIVAGALRDNRSIPLIGEKTFGKGSVQELEYLRDGSSIRISIAKWLTPKGQDINGEGIAPDAEIKLTDEDYNQDRDHQLQKALEVLDERK
jgi:carboxyl-terminal processing protease